MPIIQAVLAYFRCFLDQGILHRSLIHILLFYLLAMAISVKFHEINVQVPESRTSLSGCTKQRHRL